MIKSHQKFLNTLLVFIDAIVIVSAFVLSWFIRFESIFFTSEGAHIEFRTFLLPIIVIIPMYLLLYYAFGLYQPQRTNSLAKEVELILKSNFVGLLAFLGILFILRQIDYSRLALFIFGIVNIAMSIMERISMRLILRNMRKQGYNLKHVLVVGAGESACSYISKIDKHKYLGYNIVGFLDDEKKKNYKINQKKVIGRICDLSDIIQENELDEIIIALNLSQYDKLGWVISTCEKYGVKAQIIPDYYRYIPAKPYIDQLEDLPLINIRYVPLDDSFNRFTKRIMDITISLIGIILTSPILLTCVIMIKLTSPGPIIFKQTRVGLHRREFEMYKFRSMRLQNEEEEKAQWTTKNDPRKTRFGEFMRRTSIDELPQLFNVLKGDMSVIGPRPERPYFVEKFRDEIPKYMIKHHVRPGITGWAQVNGYRGDTSIKARIEHDIYYIENWSIWLDFKIILLTVFKGFVNKNAY